MNPRHSSRLAALLALAILLVAGPAWAQDNDSSSDAKPEAKKEAKKDDKKKKKASGDNSNLGVGVDASGGLPFQASVLVTNRFGAASAISDSEFTQTDFSLLNVNLGLTYFTPIPWLFAGVSTGFSQNLLETGGLNAQYEGRLSDTSLSISAFPLFIDKRVTGIIVSGGVDFSFPTSDLSRAEGLYTTVTPNIALIRPVGGLVIVYALSYSKNFHEATSQVLDANELDLLVRSGGADDFGANRVAIDGVLPSFSLANTFLLIGNVWPGILQARMALTFVDVWTYDNGTITSDDEFTNPNAVVGRGHRQTSIGSFGVRWLIAGSSFVGQGLVGRLQVSTAGSPLANDNESIRFPFWDFENGIASRTQITVGLGATY